VAFAVISPLTVAGAAPELLLSESTGFLSISGEITITMMESEPAQFGLLWIRTPGDPSFGESRHIIVGCQRSADDGEGDGGTGCFAKPHMQIQ
jgi:hypothetical protein